MRRRWWLNLTLAAATIGLVASGRLFAQAPPAPEASPAAPRDLEQQEAILLGRFATPLSVDEATRQRDLAAQKLLSRGTPQANGVLRRVLEDAGNREGRAAVAKALSRAANPPEELIGPLGQLLWDQDLTEPAALALAAYKGSEPALEKLVQFLDNYTRPQLGPPVAVTRALGRMVDKQAAETLIKLLNDQSLNQRIRTAAAEALAEMTGLVKYRQDVQQWNQWWQENRGKSEVDWSRDLLNKNAAMVGDLRRRLEAVRGQYLRLMREEYMASADEAERTRKVLTYLSSDSEDSRWAAVSVVYGQAGKPISPQVFEALRKMVSDNSAEVRGQVARTLRAHNDIGAVEALLTQLTQEEDSRVRADIIRALGPTQDLRVVEPLLERLNDRMFSVAEAAAESLKEMSETLRSPKNQALASRVAQGLMSRLQSTSGVSEEMLRERLVETMASLGHPSFLTTFYRLITPTTENTEMIRRLALRGLGAIGNSDSADAIVEALNDRNGRIRLSAVEALRYTATWAHAETLRRRIEESVEPDPSVREAAWRVLSEQLFEKSPTPSSSDLLAWDEAYFKKGTSDSARTRRLALLRALEKKLLAERRPRQLAEVRQTLGEVLLKLNRPTESIACLQQAYDYLLSIEANAATTEALVQLLLEAQLSSRKYVDLTQFASQVIQQDKQNSDSVWQQIRAELWRLRDAKEYAAAEQLIEEAKKIPLATVHKNALASMEKQIRDQKIRQEGGGGWRDALPENRLAWRRR